MSLEPRGDRPVTVVVHVLEVAGGQGGADHERRRHLDAQARAGSDLWPARSARSALVDAGSDSTGCPISPVWRPRARRPSAPLRPARPARRRTAAACPAPAGGGAPRSCKRARRRRRRRTDGSVARTTGTSARADGAAPALRALLDPQLAGAVPSQKKAVSRLTAGRTGSPATGGGGDAAGLYFSTRNSIVATGSSPTNQVLSVVTNHPSPSAVRFGPTTSDSRLRTATSSPRRS